MRLLMSALLLGFSLSSFALECDCTVTVHSPLTGPMNLNPTVVRQFELTNFDTYSVKNQLACRRLCSAKFEEELPSAKINEILKTHSQELIAEKILGFNCTGLTTLKYPVRAKAQLGLLSLGNVADQMHIINHEEICF